MLNGRAMLSSLQFCLFNIYIYLGWVPLNEKVYQGCRYCSFVIKFHIMLWSLLMSGIGCADETITRKWLQLAKWGMKNKQKTNELYFIPITVHRKIGSSSMGAEMRMFWSWVAYRRGRVNLSMCACAYACAYLCACVWALHFTFVWMFFFGECWWVTAIGERMKSQLWLHPSDETYTCVLLYCWTLGCKIHPQTHII